MKAYSGRKELNAIAARIYELEKSRPERVAIFEKVERETARADLFAAAFVLGVEAALYAVQTGAIKQIGEG